MNWDKETILGILHNPNAYTGTHHNGELIYRMLQRMFERQTTDEQDTLHTRHQNNVGFNAPDAFRLSRIAQRSKQYNTAHPENARWGLSPQDRVEVAQRLVKYVDQLTAIAASNRRHTPVQPNLIPPVQQSRPTQPKPPVASAAVNDIDAEVERRVQELRNSAPELFYQDGELDAEDALKMWRNKYRKELTEKPAVRDANQVWLDHKTQFASQEAEQEAQAFMSDPDYRRTR